MQLKAITNSFLSSRITRSIDNLFDFKFTLDIFGKKLADDLKVNFNRGDFLKSSYLSTREILNNRVYDSLDNLSSEQIDIMANDILNKYIVEGNNLENLIRNLGPNETILTVKNNLINQINDYRSNPFNDILSDSNSGIFQGNNKGLFDEIVKLNTMESIEKIKNNEIFDPNLIDDIEVEAKNLEDDSWRERKYDDDDPEIVSLINNRNIDEMKYEDFVQDAKNNDVIPKIDDSIGYTYEQLMMLNQRRAIDLWRRYGYRKILFGSTLLLGGIVIAALFSKTKKESKEIIGISDIKQYTNCKLKITTTKPIYLCKDGILQININNNVIVPSINGSYKTSDIIYIDSTNIILSPITNITNITNINYLGPNKIYGSLSQLNSIGSELECLNNYLNFSQDTEYENFIEGNCILDKNCILKNNFITSEGTCNNNKKRYFIDISSNTIGNGLTCSYIASQEGNGYSWSLDTSKNRIYTDLDCNNCVLPNNVTIGNCTNGTIQYTLALNQSPNDGDSCSSNLFPNNWSLSGNQFV